jgi:hypothetical protein
VSPPRFFPGHTITARVCSSHTNILGCGNQRVVKKRLVEQQQLALNQLTIIDILESVLESLVTSSPMSKAMAHLRSHSTAKASKSASAVPEYALQCRSPFVRLLQVGSSYKTAQHFLSLASRWLPFLSKPGSNANQLCRPLSIVWHWRSRSPK